MRSIKIFILAVVFISCALSTIASEQFQAQSYDVDNNLNIERFSMAYKDLNQAVSTLYTGSNISYEKYMENLLGKYMKLDKPNTFKMLDIIEVKYSKLKNTCTPITNQYMPNDISKACAKLVIDVNGFSSGTNKLLQDTKTLQVKEQFIVYLYANAVKPKPMSLEDVLLFNSSYGN